MSAPPPGPTAPPPPAGDPLRRVEQAARLLHAHGASVFLQPTVGHRRLVGPLGVTLLCAGLALLAGLWAPLPGVALLLAVAWSGVVDADGGQGWLRRMLPRRPGWVAEAELAGQADLDRPTLLIWLPVVRYSTALFLRPAHARRVLLLPVAGGGIGALGLLLRGPLGLAELDLLVLACAALFWVCALLATVVLLGRRPQAPESDATAVLSETLTDLLSGPLPPVRVLLLVGSEGATWFDDLGVWLLNHRHRYDPERTVLLALQPARPPMGVVKRDGLILARRPPRWLLDALAACDLPGVEGRTAALRAARAGIPAVGIQGPVWEEPGRLLRAVRCIAVTLTTERT